MVTLLTCLLAFVGPSGPSADEILALVSSASTMRRETAYSGVRQYTIRNARFGKSAMVRVRMSSLPGQGTLFTIEERSGANRLTSVLDKLLASEAEASRPGKVRENEIGPGNYQARIRGSEVVGLHDCFVLELTPKAKSKYLVSGTAWVDKKTYGVVRLSGSTAASVSMWVGTPQIVEDFSLIEGIWLPSHLFSTSTSMLLGESSLEIHFADYQVMGTVTARSKAPGVVKARL
jgi:hypothetical protein